MFVQTRELGTVGIPADDGAARDLLILQRWYPRIRLEVEDRIGRKSLIPITDLLLEDGSTIEPEAQPLFSRLRQIRFT